MKTEFDFLEGNTGSDALQQKMTIIKELKDDKRNMLQQLNDMSENLEDVLAENRILRKMNNIPDNWGCEPQKRIIKLQDRETVFEYKRLVKILQEDNYNLEKERARLKHRLKQQAIYSGVPKDDKYKDLTPEQVYRLNEFLIKLRQGEVDDDKSMYDLIEENRSLKKELEILRTRGYDVIKQQLEAFFRDNKGSLFAGMNFNDSKSNSQDMTEEQKKFMLNLQKQQDQMKGLVENIWGGMAGGTLRPPLGYIPSSELEIGQDEAGRFGPPRVTGIGSGYSTKFGMNLNIPMAGSANPKDLPSLQLQLVELFALNDRKDSQIKTLENELERAYTRVRRYLLMQDQLYLNYAEELQGFKEKSLKQEKTLSQAKDELREEQIKSENYRKTIRSLRLDPDSMSNELVNLQKKLALVEVENFKLAKKYAIIYEQEKQLREAYHKIEEGYIERERFATERITSLKEWQIKAINEIKFLYSKFRDAIPLSEYQAISKDLFIYKQKFADVLEKCNKQAINNSRLQSENRILLTAGEKLKMYEEMRIDTENELEVIKNRLELVDPLFKWENAIFKRVIAVLKARKISPRQIFDHFDKDGSGKLSSKEFLNALDKMGISDLNAKEREILLRSVDADLDGTIDYREFCRKCKREGVNSRSREDEIVYIIDQTLQKNGLELSTMFEMMDKNGKGVITKEDFKDTLINSRVKVDRKDLENFVDLFWKGRDEGINYRDFIRIYNKFKVRFEEEEGNKEKVKGQLEVTDKMIERMKWIFDKLNEVFKKNEITLKDAFDKIDQSSDKKITRIELKRMFDAMGVTVRDNELEMIFRRMDFDDSGAITYLEFESEFKRIVETPVENLKAVNQEIKRATTSKFGGDFNPSTEDYLLSAEVSNTRKINNLESKVTQYEKKIEMFKGRLQKSEDSQISWERDYDTLEKKYLEVNEKYQEILEREQAANSQQVGTLTKEKSEELVLRTERQREQITDLHAAMSSYKSLFEIAASQAKTLKLSNKRSHDQEENLLYALRELQSDTVDKLKLGRIYYILMLSRWQEAAIGMKYDYVLNDIRTLRNEYSIVEIRMSKEEGNRHESENALRNKSLQVEKLKQELHAKTASGISMARAEEISRALQDLADEKSDVEEKYIKIYSEMNTMRFKMTEFEARAEHSEEMLNVLRNSTDSEVSERLIEIADKISQIRRNELRSKREAEEFQEKANYSEKRVAQQKKTIVDLEDQLADLESLMHRKEEEWRRADNERQKKFFDQQFVNFETENRYKGFSDDQPIGLNKEKFQREDLVSPPVGEFLIKKSDVRIMQAKLRNAQEEITGLQVQIVSKDRQLDRLREWQLEDKLLGEDEKMRDIIDSNKVKVDQMHEKESKEMAQAAVKTIKTLQEMVESKNNQNKRKEEIINDIKKRMAEQKAADTRELVRLNDELSKALKEKSGADYAFRETHVSREHKEYEAISRRELEKLLYQKDDELENLSNQVASLRREKEYLLESKDAGERDKMNMHNDDLTSNSTKRIRALQKDVDRLTKQLQSKQKIEDRLKDSIQQITDKLTKLEEMKGITDEDVKMDRLTKKSKTGDESSRIEELEKMLKAKERRLTTTTAKCKTYEKELKEEKEKYLKMKEVEHELKEEVKNGLIMRQKLVDNYQNEKREAKAKERQSKKGEGSKVEGSSNTELKAIIRDLQNEITLIKKNQKPMVAYNGQTGSFEYIGEASPLRGNGEACADIEEIIRRTKDWLKHNDRITVVTIFNSFDFNKSGFIEKELLFPIFVRMGVKLHKNEADIIFNCLNSEDEFLCKYRPLIIELTTGPSQIEFIPQCCIKVAEQMIASDVDQFQILTEVDKSKSGHITLAELKDGLEVLFPKKISNLTVDEAFIKFKSADERSKMDAQLFTDRVGEAKTALLLGKIKIIIQAKGQEYALDVREGRYEETKGLNIDNEFSKIDKEHDGILTYDQFKQLLDVYKVEGLTEKAKRDLMDLLDQDKKSLVSLSYFKLMLDLPRTGPSNDAHFGLDMKPMKDSYRIQEDLEIEENARKALRRIYQKNNLLDRLFKQLKVYDHDKDGVMARSSLHQSIADVTKDVHEDDINYIIQYADKRNKGFFNPDNFFDNISKLAQEEAKHDAILRRLGNVLRHKGIDLEVELMKNSKNNSGVVDSYDFMKTMRELRIGLDSNDMDELVTYACQGEKFVEVKWF
jgi:Ca2+-binding EF-hand superfamily protein